MFNYLIYFNSTIGPLNKYCLSENSGGIFLGLKLIIKKYNLTVASENWSKLSSLFWKSCLQSCMCFRKRCKQNKRHYFVSTTQCSNLTVHGSRKKTFKRKPTVTEAKFSWERGLNSGLPLVWSCSDTTHFDFQIGTSCSQTIQPQALLSLQHPNKTNMAVKHLYFLTPPSPFLRSTLTFAQLKNFEVMGVVRYKHRCSRF